MTVVGWRVVSGRTASSMCIDRGRALVAGEADTLISQDAFPAELRGQGIQTSVVVAVGVSPLGRATGCSIATSSGYEALDRLTCDIFMRRARFTPAVDATGQPVAGSMSRRVSWQSE